MEDGTPSIIDAKYIKEVVDSIKGTQKNNNIEEITIEVNPRNCKQRKIRTIL